MKVKDNTILSKPELIGLIKYFEDEEAYILANLTQLDNAHEALEETNQTLLELEARLAVLN